MITNKIAMLRTSLPSYNDIQATKASVWLHTATDHNVQRTAMGRNRLGLGVRVWLMSVAVNSHTPKNHYLANYCCNELDTWKIHANL